MRDRRQKHTVKQHIYISFAFVTRFRTAEIVYTYIYLDIRWAFHIVYHYTQSRLPCVQHTHTQTAMHSGDIWQG